MLCSHGLDIGMLLFIVTKVVFVVELTMLYHGGNIIRDNNIVVVVLVLLIVDRVFATVAVTAMDVKIRLLFFFYGNIIYDINIIESRYTSIIHCW